MSDVARWMSEEPARLAGLSRRAGALEPGRDASFVVFDPEAEWTVRPEDLPTRHAISPYVGEGLRGRVLATYLRGERIWNGNRFEGEPAGRELRLC